ncbi:hypothetical protein D3795_01885 [Pseudidiomarina andamanensis]|uniref:Uncharacterized protein n=1 Tax=Pseudidiomarina andamanensis TaxID=1940690 RepID=A0AA92IKZ4_9GAMM|nr:hypothetical protein D3795_01885 [Pseudidiomarina andamanensis]
MTTFIILAFSALFGLFCSFVMHAFYQEAAAGALGESIDYCVFTKQDVDFYGKAGKKSAVEQIK